MQKIKKLITQYKEIIFYLVFGVLTTLVNIITYSIATEWFSINYQVSNIISWIVSVTFAFITNKLFVFESKKIEKTTLIREGISFYGFRVISLGMDMLVMYIMVSILTMNDLFAKIISNVIVIVVNYVFSKLFVFKKNQ